MTNSSLSHIEIPVGHVLTPVTLKVSAPVDFKSEDLDQLFKGTFQTSTHKTISTFDVFNTNSGYNMVNGQEKKVGSSNNVLFESFLTTVVKEPISVKDKK